MARANVPFLAFNRGLLSPKALARVDLDRTRLSAEVFTNWLPKTQGALTIRPGTKWFGSSLNDTGAQYLEFIASTDDVALIELTHQKMRLWIGSDAHALSLLGRPAVNTTLSLTDTGWADTSAGGAFTGRLISSVDAIPTMVGATTNGVTVSASSENVVHNSDGLGGSPFVPMDSEDQPVALLGGNRAAWKAADDNNNSGWQDTGSSNVSSLPSTWAVDFGASNTKSIARYSIRAGPSAVNTNNAPKAWTLESSDNGSVWTVEQTKSNITGWAAGEKRTYTTAEGDTGTVTAHRFWRLNVSAVDGDTELIVSEIEMFEIFSSSAQQILVSGGKLTLNATAIGSLARREKRVVVSDTGTEHSLSLYVERGPVTLRVGSTQRDDDYISETELGTGYHNLALTPTTPYFWVTLQTDEVMNRIVGSLAVGDSGTVEVTAPWEANALDNVRYDQSADVVYADSDGVRPSKIERRGTGRSWSVVDYAPDNGPFLPSPSSGAKLSPAALFGNTTLASDIPFFSIDHVGALMRIFHTGQSGQWRLGAVEAKTDAIEVNGYNDTGTGTGGERRVSVSVTGTWSGTITLERSIDGADRGFHPVDTNFMANALATDTGSFTRTIFDTDDNVQTWYRARISAYSSGVAIVVLTYQGGGITGIARVTDFASNVSVSIEVLSRFSATGASENWQEGFWSAARSFPAAVALHGGRLAHARGGQLFMSVSDDYENFDDATIGDAAPIVKTLGSGPVDSIRFLMSLLRLIIGTAGAELTARSSSLDEPLTPTNCNASTPFSTQGAASLRAVKIDTKAAYVQRSGQRLLVAGAGGGGSTSGDYEAADLTRLVPDLLEAGVVSIAVQRQPDTRIHACLGDGRVAILTYEPGDEVVAWSMWQTDTGTSGAVEKVMSLPGTVEDAVYYHVRRTINGSTKRYLEKWAKESECTGDSGLTGWLMDCAKSYTDTGQNAALVDIAPHLVGESVVVWSDDTGSIPGVDRSPDVDGVQVRWTPDTGGDITLGVAVHHSIAGLPYKATWESSKLAYAAELGSALAQEKRAPQLGLLLFATHNRGLRYGSDTGHLDDLPRMIEGAVVDDNQIHQTLDMVAVPIPSRWHPDARLVLRGKSPRPATVLAAIPTVVTHEK
jgi:hypothetical protein